MGSPGSRLLTFAVEPLGADCGGGGGGALGHGGGGSDHRSVRLVRGGTREFTVTNPSAAVPLDFCVAGVARRVPGMTFHLRDPTAVASRRSGAACSAFAAAPPAS